MNSAVGLIWEPGATTWHPRAKQRRGDKNAPKDLASPECWPVASTVANLYNALHMLEPVNEADRLRNIFHGVFATHPAHVALLDLQANILAVNDAWIQFARSNGLRSDYAFGGANYLQVCEPAAAIGDAYARDAYLGLLQVLRSNRPKFTLVYPCHSPLEQRWFGMWVQPQTPEADAIVVAHNWLGQSRPQEQSGDPEAQMQGMDGMPLDAGAYDLRLLRPARSILMPGRR